MKHGLFSTSQLVASTLLFSRLATAHIEILYPEGAWPTNETLQETGAFCGGGSSANLTTGYLPFTEGFIGLNGDAGDVVNVRALITDSNTTQPQPTSVSDFTTLIASNVTIPSNGTFCVNVTSIEGAASRNMSSYSAFYIESVSSDGSSVSSCMTVAIEDYELASYPFSNNDVNLTNPDGSVMTCEGTTGYETNPAVDALIADASRTDYDFFCTGNPPPVVDTCGCHCHGTENHCVGSCTDAQLNESQAHCEATGAADGHDDEDEGAEAQLTGLTAGCDCHCHGDHSHCSSTACTDADKSSANAQCAAAASGSSTAAASASSGVAAAPAAQPTGAAMARFGSYTRMMTGVGLLSVSALCMLVI